MRLSEKQALFASLVAVLIHWCGVRGWKLTLSEGYDDDDEGHMPNSLHYIRMAQDLNLFVDGNYIADGSHPVWKEIGELWERLHPLCRWGGRFGDANHISLEHGGRK